MHCFDPRDQLLGLKVEEQPKSWHTESGKLPSPSTRLLHGSPSLWAGGAVQCGHVGQAAGSPRIGAGVGLNMQVPCGFRKY